jgi:hypothetical protein
MRIQIIETNKQSYDVSHLQWFKDSVATSGSLYGVEKFDWLHAEAIDFSCDVFFKNINSTQLQIGFLSSDTKTLTANQQLHWVTVEMLGKAQFDALTQILLITIGIGRMPSVTGGYSSDWADIRTVLSHGTKALCVEFNWSESQQAIKLIEAAMLNSKSPAGILSCAMLLNQGLPG